MSLSTLIYDAPHGLERHAYHPRAMVSGTVNVDGTGIAWWPVPVEEPLVYVTELTPWSDPNLPRLAPRLTAGMQLAAVRSATPGMPAGPAAALPFVSGQVAFAHNGRLEGFERGIGRRLLERLPDELFAAATVMTDSVALFLNFLLARRWKPGAPPICPG